MMVWPTGAGGCPHSPPRSNAIGTLTDWASSSARPAHCGVWTVALRMRSGRMCSSASLRHLLGSREGHSLSWRASAPSWSKVPAIRRASSGYRKCSLRGAADSHSSSCTCAFMAPTSAAATCPSWWPWTDWSARAADRTPHSPPPLTLPPSTSLSSTATSSPSARRPHSRPCCSSWPGRPCVCSTSSPRTASPTRTPMPANWPSTSHPASHSTRPRRWRSRMPTTSIPRPTPHRRTPPSSPT
mmetsp:Transcript_34169/g.98403  ORF Transcript_34169/g.98403 Transcript_34169/m.98403 type:complete len:242 (+) Transcript_34169:306-1031(+)